MEEMHVSMYNCNRYISILWNDDADGNNILIHHYTVTCKKKYIILLNCIIIKSQLVLCRNYLTEILISQLKSITVEFIFDIIRTN